MLPVAIAVFLIFIYKLYTLQNTFAIPNFFSDKVTSPPFNSLFVSCPFFFDNRSNYTKTTFTMPDVAYLTLSTPQFQKIERPVFQCSILVQ